MARKKQQQTDPEAIKSAETQARRGVGNATAGGRGNRSRAAGARAAATVPGSSLLDETLRSAGQLREAHRQYARADHHSVRVALGAGDAAGGSSGGLAVAQAVRRTAAPPVSASSIPAHMARSGQFPTTPKAGHSQKRSIWNSTKSQRSWKHNKRPGKRSPYPLTGHPGLKRECKSRTNPGENARRAFGPAGFVAGTPATSPTPNPAYPRRRREQAARRLLPPLHAKGSSARQRKANQANAAGCSRCTFAPRCATTRHGRQAINASRSRCSCITPAPVATDRSPHSGRRRGDRQRAES